MRLATTATLCTALALFLPAPAHAFNYDEHCRMSNHALRIAKEAMAARHKRLRDSLEASPSFRALLSEVSVCSEKAPMPRSYGDLVSRVDWARAPGDFYLANMAPGKGGRFSTGEIPWARVDALVATPLQSFRAMHENNEHFGGHALFYFDTWHNRAVELASRGELAAALVHNAFADHYLQDHFAPGHIYTPRSGLADVVTPNMHDWYNQRGAYYRAARTDALAELLDRLGSGDQMPGPVQELVRKVCGTVGTWAEARTQIAPCLAEFEAADTLRLYGDGLLATSPRQELFVTLVMARSLADVLESWATERPRERFGEKRWCGYTERARTASDPRGATRLWRSPVAAMEYGTYRPENGYGLPDFQIPLVAAVALESYAYSPSPFRVSFAHEKHLKGWIGGAWLGDESVGRGGLATVKTNQSTYRGLEVFLGCELGPTRCQQVGGGYYRRYLFPVTLVNTQLSTLMGARVATPPEGGRGPALSLRGGASVEGGFSLFHLGGRVMVEGTVVRGRGPSVTLGLAPTLHVAVPRRYSGLPLENPGAVPPPVSLAEAEQCFSGRASTPSLEISNARP
jgi:hypothetical protein